MRYILEELKGAKSIGIAGHVRPDGDCIGSCMALYHYLRNNLPNDTLIDVYLESIPRKLSVVPATDLVKHGNDDGKQYEIFISLDSSSLDRLGFAMDLFNESVKTINIDHHISNTNFAEVNHVVDNASSTCEVLYDLFEEDKIDINVATALYLGLIHDTGVFKHSNTTEKTMNIAGKLISKGVPFSRMIDETFYLKTFVQNQLLGRCLLESIVMLEGKCIVSSIHKKMLDFYDASSEDLDGIIDQLRVTDGTEVAIFIYETKFHEYKVSMRANGAVDVRKVAAYFGGGGHIKAAGCTMQGSLHDVINNLMLHIEHQLFNKSTE
jgi:bifunctional oligoribonuclease and PAP phosphatase NrnA